MAKRHSPEGPFLKWVGGKGSLVEQLASYVPKDMTKRCYFEPFVGGGALFFHLAPRLETSFLSDLNRKLIKTYRVVRDAAPALRTQLRELEADRRRVGLHLHFERARSLFNDGTSDVIKQAALFIYLNRSCFNGLYRENADGEFNVSFGHHVNPPAIDSDRITNASVALQRSTLWTFGYESALAECRPNDVVYLDPPYIPIEQATNFSGYTKAGFGDAEQVKLADEFRALSKRGVWALLSNSDTPRTRELYKGFRLIKVSARRSVAASAASRAPARELIILSERVMA